jgi:uncharacterized protein YbjQ (UPF0145 family)
MPSLPLCRCAGLRRREVRRPRSQGSARTEQEPGPGGLNGRSPSDPISRGDDDADDHDVEGRRVVEYHGLVTGEAIMGANVFRDMFASVRDIVGGRSAAYERELNKAKDIAIGEMARKELGCNAVISVDLDYETVSEGSMLMVSASGTAVRLSEPA